MKFYNIENGAHDVEIDKVIISTIDKDITIEYITEGWEINYERTCDCSFVLEYFGVNVGVYELLHSKINNIHVSGQAFNLDDETQYSFCWNIPCEMYVSELYARDEEDGCTVGHLRLAGRMW